MEFKTITSDDNPFLDVAVDDCHLDLVYGLIRSHKPDNVLEMGVGSGKTTVVLIKALKKNENLKKLTLVDNWIDWKGNKPTHIQELEEYIDIVESDEKEFLFSCNKSFDFIFSDADHWNTDKWFDYVYDRILSNNGILIYHDVSREEIFRKHNKTEIRFSNLENILIKCKQRGISHVHLDKCSTPEERCYRGFLVIFKSQLQNITVSNNSLLVNN
jgi:predicted O-methyltransferase YrrM